MKIKLKYAQLCLFLTSTLLLSCSGGNEKIDDPDSSSKKEGIGTTTSNEDIIDLVKHPVDSAYGYLKIRMSQYTILSSLGKPFPIKIDSIHEDALEKLKTLALDLGNGYTGRYVLAVKMTYGLNPSNDKIKIFYQPIFFKNVSSIAGQRNKVPYEAIVSAEYYECIHTPKHDFVTVSVSTRTTAVSNYTANVNFKRDDNALYRNFYDAQDSTGDVKAIIYSLQEIDSVMHGNNLSQIFILNAIQELTVSKKDYLKHSLLIGPDPDDLKFVAPPLFYRKYGNLSHLCPPSCNSVIKAYDIK